VGVAGRLPQTPRQIADRFRSLLASSELSALGTTGRGVLTISGGMAVFPYDATEVAPLIDAADRALMFGAKQAGKNSIFLVGSDDQPSDLEP
jgi:GGDEF domain-containing protein